MNIYYNFIIDSIINILLISYLNKIRLILKMNKYMFYTRTKSLIIKK